MVQKSDLQFLDVAHIRLRLETWSDAARTVQVRGFTAKGRVIGFDQTTNSNRTKKTTNSTIGGLPKAVTASTTATSIIKGQLYARLSLLVEGSVVEVLCAGYIHDGQTLSWMPGQGTYEKADVDWSEIPPTLEADETADDSDKSLDVPSGEQWQIIWILVELTTTATVGDRHIHVDFRDSEDDNVYHSRALAVQTASTTEYYMVLPGVGEPTEGLAGQHYLPIPIESKLRAGYDVRISDGAAIDAAADDLTIQMLVKARLEI